MYRHLLFILLLSFLTPAYAGGQTAVLVHGYLSDGLIWRDTGVSYILHQAGWQDAGDLFPAGPVPAVLPPANPKGRYVYTVTLPSEAPLPVQAHWLDFYLRELQRRHPENQLILIGHSAGGVVARLVMVTNRFPIAGLITIATPHLGTSAAEDGLLLSNSPVGWVAPFLGLGTLTRSEDLYRDLTREYPAMPLFWLNRTPHPPQAFYLSIIRLAGDDWVPPYSQDMNNVPALTGKAMVATTRGEHGLHPGDGYLLVTWLEKLGEVQK